MGMCILRKKVSCLSSIKTDYDVLNILKYTNHNYDEDLAIVQKEKTLNEVKENVRNRYETPSTVFCTTYSMLNLPHEVKAIILPN